MDSRANSPWRIFKRPADAMVHPRPAGVRLARFEGAKKAAEQAPHGFTDVALRIGSGDTNAKKMRQQNHPPAREQGRKTGGL
jgi:hypothetical protein